MKRLTVESQGTPSLMLTHCWTEPESEDSEVLPALWWVNPSSRMRARSWSLVAKPRGPKAGGADWFLTQFFLGSECVGVCWLASGQGQGPASLRSESGLLMDMLGDSGFLESGFWPLVCEAAPETRPGSLEGRAWTQGILGLTSAQ